MKRTLSLKRICILALALLVWNGTVYGQNEKQIKKFNADRKAYFNKYLALSNSEKEAFWPVYNDFINRKMKVKEEERNTFRYSQENAGNLSDKETNEILDRILDYKKQVFQLEQDYYKDKFPSVLPPDKVLKLYQVEWDFRKHLVKKIREEGKSNSLGGNSGGQRSMEKPPIDPELPSMGPELLPMDPEPPMGPELLPFF